MQTNDDLTMEDGIWSERLSDGYHSYLYITKENPATYIWDDDNGYVFIRWDDFVSGNTVYKVQSIDLDYILERSNG